jgi:hypothetical protein
MNSKLPQFNDNQIEIVEKRTIKRITLRFYLKSIFDAFNLERGGFYTLKRLIINPGQMVQHYLAEGRFRYTPPFRLLIITTTLALLILKYSNTGADFAQGFDQNLNNEEFKEVLNSLSAFQNLFLWLAIPFYALFQFLLNRKSGYNYTENLVQQTYLFTIANLASLIIGLDVIVNKALVSFLSVSLYFGYYIYAYKVFFQKSWGRSFLENVLIIILSSIAYMLLLVVLMALLALIVTLSK